MSTSTSSTSNPNWLMRFLLFISPGWIKRMLVICSFASKYAHVTTEDLQSLVRLNQILSLTHSEDAMKFPLLVSQFVWTDDAQVESLLNIIAGVEDKNLLTRCAVSLVDKLPKCMRWGNRGDMISDFTELLCVMPALRHN